jgi:predicted polyphosphate/ATP-dependent NAD kinase
MPKRIGLIVNPVAGMGGSVGLKGTDGAMRDLAIELGAKPVAPARTREFLSHIRHRDDITLLVAPAAMGDDYLEGIEIDATAIGSVDNTTSGEDTKRLAGQMLAAEIDLLVFVGGDGTARDICDAIGLELPVVGVPSGVKVYGSVFALSARAAAAMLDAFVEGVEVSEEEVLDIDEQAFRRGILDAKLYGYLLVPNTAQFLQGGKEASNSGGSIVANKQEIAEYVAGHMERDTLYLLGPGTTVQAIADELSTGKTLLGVDAVFNNRLIGTDLNERGILKLLDQHPRTKLIVTPLGGNGFIFGRGNRQFTPEVIAKVGRENIVVVATRDKIDKLKCLRVDTDDYGLDRELSGYMDVITGYKYSKLVRVEC